MSTRALIVKDPVQIPPKLSTQGLVRMYYLTRDAILFRSKFTTAPLLSGLAACVPTFSVCFNPLARRRVSDGVILEILG